MTHEEWLEKNGFCSEIGNIWIRGTYRVILDAGRWQATDLVSRVDGHASPRDALLALSGQMQHHAYTLRATAFNIDRRAKKLANGLTP